MAWIGGRRVETPAGQMTVGRAVRKASRRASRLRDSTKLQETIDEGIALLTGRRAGPNQDVGTVNGLVNKRLQDLATGLKAFAAPAGSETEQRKLSDNENHQPNK